MILESDTTDGACNGCKEEAPYGWGTISFEDWLLRHDCGNKTQLTLSRLAAINAKLGAVIEEQNELREAIADLRSLATAPKRRSHPDDTDY